MFQQVLKSKQKFSTQQPKTCIWMNIKIRDKCFQRILLYCKCQSNLFAGWCYEVAFLGFVVPLKCPWTFPIIFYSENTGDVGFTRIA